VTTPQSLHSFVDFDPFDYLSFQLFQTISLRLPFFFSGPIALRRGLDSCLLYQLRYPQGSFKNREDSTSASTPGVRRIKSTISDVLFSKLLQQDARFFPPFTLREFKGSPFFLVIVHPVLPTGLRRLSSFSLSNIPEAPLSVGNGAFQKLGPAISPSPLLSQETIIFWRRAGYCNLPFLHQRSLSALSPSVRPWPFLNSSVVPRTFLSPSPNSSQTVGFGISQPPRDTHVPLPSN